MENCRRLLKRDGIQNRDVENLKAKTNIKSNYLIYDKRRENLGVEGHGNERPGAFCRNLDL